MKHTIGWRSIRIGSLDFGWRIYADPSQVRFSNVFIDIFTQITNTYISGLMFSHVFIDMFTKITKNMFSGLTFSHVFIDIVLSGECYS